MNINSVLPYIQEVQSWRIDDKPLLQNSIAGVEESSQNDPIPSSSLSFGMDPDLNMIIVKIKNAATGETLSQIPPEDSLRIAKHLKKAYDDSMGTSKVNLKV